MILLGIYKIQSQIKSERIYIGSAVSFTKRWNLHLHKLRTNKHENSKLQNHYNKYGESDLQFSILVGCDKEDLIKQEQFFIDFYNPYFNICKKAGSSLGVIRSEETNKKNREKHLGSKNVRFGKKLTPQHIKILSIANKGKTVSLEMKNYLREINLGKKYSEETNKKKGGVGIKNPFYGKHHSEETKRSLRESHIGKGHKVSEEIKIKLRKPKSELARINMKKARNLREQKKIA